MYVHGLEIELHMYVFRKKQNVWREKDPPVEVKVYIFA